MFFIWKASNQSNANYDAGNEIFSNTVLTSNLCDSNDAYTLARGDAFPTVHNIST